MNNKGQALVEFAIVLPILLIILLYILDFYKISLKRYELENKMDIIINLYENDLNHLNSYIEENDLTIEYNYDDKLTTLTLSQESSYNMPLLKNIFGEKIKIKRVIYEQ